MRSNLVRKFFNLFTKFARRLRVRIVEILFISNSGVEQNEYPEKIELNVSEVEEKKFYNRKNTEGRGNPLPTKEQYEELQKQKKAKKKKGKKTNGIKRPSTI